MDLNHDGKITNADVDLIIKLSNAYRTGESEYEQVLNNEIDQNVYAIDPNKITL